MKRLQMILLMALVVGIVYVQPLYAADGPTGTGKTMSAQVIANDLGSSGRETSQEDGEVEEGGEPVVVEGADSREEDR
jgi:hypothetical protein